MSVAIFHPFYMAFSAHDTFKCSSINEGLIVRIVIAQNLEITFIVFYSPTIYLAQISS